MGNAAQVMTERVGGAAWKPAVVGGAARKLQVVPPVDPRTQLRAAVVERLARDTENFLKGLAGFLDSPECAGLANVSVVVSRSTVTQDLWKDPRQSAPAREHLARTLGLAAEVDNATLMGALLAQVDLAFEEFEASARGQEFREGYGVLLERCDALGVMPVLLGHDVGPMVPELARLGVPLRPDFARSLLIDPRVLALVPFSPELVEGQVLVSGASVSQLGALVTQMRQFNPVLSNAQVRAFFARALTEGTERKLLGRAEIEQLHDWSRQILRLQFVSRLVA